MTTFSTPLGPVPANLAAPGLSLSSFDVNGNPQTNTLLSISFIPTTLADEDGNPLPMVGYSINGGVVVFPLGQLVWVSPPGKAAWRVVHAQAIQVGDEIATDTNDSILVASVDPVEIDGWWRLEVSGDHSYMADGFQVHNASLFFCADQDHNTHVASGRTNWSSTSGAKDNAAEPTSAATAILDSNSGGTCTVNAGLACAGFDTTGGTGTYTSTLDHSANVITFGLSSTTAVIRLNSSMTYTNGGGWTKAGGLTSYTVNVTTAGKTLAILTLSGATGAASGCVFTLQDDCAVTTISTAGAFRGGTLALNGHTFACDKLNLAVTTPTIDWGSSATSKLVLTGVGAILSAGTITQSNIVAGAEIQVTNATSTSETIAFGTSFSQSNLKLTYASGADNLIITATTALTLGTIDVSGSATNGMTFQASLTTTVAGLTSANAPNGGSKIKSSSGGTQATISCANPVTVNNLSVTDITAAGAGNPFTTVNGSLSNTNNWTNRQTLGSISGTMTRGLSRGMAA